MSSIAKVMQVEVQKLGKSQVELIITVSEEKKNEAVKKATNQLAKNLKIGGFRKGKVPPALAAQHIDPADALQLALERNLMRWYGEAMEEQDLKPVTRPEFDVKELEKDLVFTTKLTLLPEVKLGDYRSIKLERKKIEISEKDVDAQIAKMMQSYASYEPVKKAIEDNLQAELNVEAFLDGEEVKAFHRENHVLIIGDGYFAPGFDEQVLGLKKEDKKEFDLKFPDTYPIERFKGKTLQFKVEILEVSEHVVPELTEEKLEEEGFKEGMEKFRDNVRYNLTIEQEREEQKRIIKEIEDQLIKKTTVEVPEAYVADEINEIRSQFEHRLKQHGIQMKAWLRMNGKDEKHLQEEWKPQAERMAHLNLALDEIAKEEKIEITDEEIDAEIQELMTNYRDYSKQSTPLSQEGRDLKKRLRTPRGGDFLRTKMRRTKAMNVVYQVALPDEQNEEAGKK